MSVVVVGALWHTPLDDMGPFSCPSASSLPGAAILGPKTSTPALPVETEPETDQSRAGHRQGLDARPH